MHKAHLEHKDQIFILRPYAKSSIKPPKTLVVYTDKPVTGEVMRNAWTYAVKYTATALNTPNYDAAVNLLLQRHPGWKIVDSIVLSVEVELDNAGEDIPDV